MTSNHPNQDSIEGLTEDESLGGQVFYLGPTLSHGEAEVQKLSSMESKVLLKLVATSRCLNRPGEEQRRCIVYGAPLRF